MLLLIKLIQKLLNILTLHFLHKETYMSDICECGVSFRFMDENGEAYTGFHAPNCPVFEEMKRIERIYKNTL